MSSDVQSLPEDVETDGPEVGVRASLSVPNSPDRVWRHLISADGTEALLGDGARLGNKGEPWHAGDGSYGVVRSYHAMEQIRVTWHPHADGPLSMLDVQLHPDGDGTRLDIFHEGRGIAEDPRGDQSHWQDALDRLAAGIPG